MLQASQSNEDKKDSSDSVPEIVTNYRLKEVRIELQRVKLPSGMFFSQNIYIIDPFLTSKHVKVEIENDDFYIGQEFESVPKIEPILLSSKIGKYWYCPYDSCEYKSKYKNAFDQHKYKHCDSPYKCDLCDHKFTTAYNLKQHRQTCKGKKWFENNVQPVRRSSSENEKYWYCPYDSCEYKSLNKIQVHRHIPIH